MEKPENADDHNVWIYYPHGMGGGVKKLFRKVDNKSSNYERYICKGTMLSYSIKCDTPLFLLPCPPAFFLHVLMILLPALFFSCLNAPALNFAKGTYRPDLVMHAINCTCSPPCIHTHFSTCLHSSCYLHSPCLRHCRAACYYLIVRLFLLSRLHNFTPASALAPDPAAHALAPPPT